MLLDWLMEAEKDSKIKANNLLMAALIFYALVDGSITYPALFSGGHKRVSIETMFEEIVATFLGYILTNYYC